VGDLALRHLHLPGVTVITVGGELDMMTAPRLEAFVRQVRRPGDQVVFDLADMTFMDCSGLRGLLRVLHEARQDGSTVRLAAVRPFPARVLEIANIGTRMPVHATLELALTAAREHTCPPRPQGPHQVGLTPLGDSK
jgi:anti-sigma B factor antagonist